MQFRQQASSTILILLDFDPNLQQDQIELEFSPKKASFTSKFDLISDVQKEKIQVSIKPDQAKLESDRRTATLVSNLNNYLGGSAELASLGLMLFNLDLGGHLMKLTQM